MSDRMKFLAETIESERKPVVTEATVDNSSGEKFFYLKGLFIEGETRNHNGRVYPANEIAKAVNSLNKRIKQFGPIAGELDHPEGLNINFNKISHVITEMSMRENNGYGTMRVINAGEGLIVGACIKAGMQVGVSSRGSGNVDGSGVVTDFDIITIDIVANPSAPNAYPQATLAESMMRNKHGKEALSLSQYYHDDAAAQRYFEESVVKFLNDIRDQVTWRK